MILTMQNNQNFDRFLQTMISKQIELEMCVWSHIVANWIFYAKQALWYLNKFWGKYMQNKKTYPERQKFMTTT